MPEGELERWAKENDPIDRYVAVLLEQEGFSAKELEAVDARVMQEIDVATDEAEKAPMPEPTDALVGIYADPPVIEPLWFRRDKGGVVGEHERPAGWGTYDG